MDLEAKADKMQWERIENQTRETQGREEMSERMSSMN